MADDFLGDTARFEAVYWGTRDAVFSVISGVAWALIGIFGVGLLWLTAIALTNGTASTVTFFAALFGAVITVLAGDELVHRLLGGTPVL